MTSFKLAIDEHGVREAGAYARYYKQLTGYPLVIPPSMYDSLERAGCDMGGMIPTPLLPITKT